MHVEQDVNFNLKALSTIKNRESRIQATRQLLLKNNAIATFVQYTYHPNVVFFEFEPTFGDDLNEPEVVEVGPMYRAIRSMKHLMTSHSPTVTEEKRRSIFLGMLSSVSRSDAALLKTAVLERRLPFKTLGKDFFEEAMPELFPKVEEVA